MANKLFQKLNEQVEINKIKSNVISESERNSIETKVIFEGINTKRIEDLNIQNEQ